MAGTTTEIPSETDGRAKTVLPAPVINHPSLDMLGTCQPEICGHGLGADVERLCCVAASAHALAIEFRQSDFDAQISRWIQEERTTASAIKPAGFTSTSIAIRDGLLMFEGPIFECHISPPFRRHEFRRLSTSRRPRLPRPSASASPATGLRSPASRSRSRRRPDMRRGPK